MSNDLRSQLQADMAEREQVVPDYYKSPDGEEDLLDQLFREKGIEGIRIFCEWTARKYMKRFARKGGILDLRKAREYLRRLILFEIRAKDGGGKI